MGKYAALVALLLLASPAWASRCLMPSARQDFEASDVVVAAEARAVSAAPDPHQSGKFLQEIRWRVHESWKGQYAFGNELTTRNSVGCPTCSMYKVRPGRLMVLYLRGKEPYPLPWCSRTNFLEYSLKDIPMLYKLSGAEHGT